MKVFFFTPRIDSCNLTEIRYLPTRIQVVGESKISRDTVVGVVELLIGDFIQMPIVSG